MAAPHPSQTADKFIIRLPDGMRDQIAEAAKANNRTMNAEIVARLQASFSEERQPGLTKEELLQLVNAAIDERIEREKQLKKKR
jgi:hypothetical protein